MCNNFLTRSPSHRRHAEMRVALDSAYIIKDTDLGKGRDIHLLLRTAVVQRTMDGLLLLGFLAIVALVSGYLQRRRLQLPPRPKGLPIVGNAFDIPENFEWEVYDKWSREYGTEFHWSFNPDSE